MSAPPPDPARLPKNQGYSWGSSTSISTKHVNGNIVKTTITKYKVTLTDGTLYDSWEEVKTEDCGSVKTKEMSVVPGTKDKKKQSVAPPDPSRLPKNQGYSWGSSTSTSTKHVNGNIVKTTITKYKVTLTDGTLYDSWEEVKTEDGGSVEKEALGVLPGKDDLQKQCTLCLNKGLPLNEKLLKFVYSKHSQKIGDGQCYATAAVTLSSIGAREARGFDFGKKIKETEIYPGDIIQFSWAKFKGNSVGGGTYQKNCGNAASNGAHTAIVYSYDVNTRSVCTLEQNMNNILKVCFGGYAFEDMYEGSFDVFRPVAK